MNVLTHCHNILLVGKTLFLSLVLTSYIKYLIVIISCDMVLIEGLYSGVCAVSEKKRGGGGVSVLHEGDTH